jgi:hypothetical protein
MQRTAGQASSATDQETYLSFSLKSTIQHIELYRRAESGSPAIGGWAETSAIADSRTPTCKSSGGKDLTRAYAAATIKRARRNGGEFDDLAGPVCLNHKLRADQWLKQSL